jgi:predicted NBD/HSP70 family sugar kinase
MRIVADIGGTTMRVALSEAPGHVGEHKVAETPATMAEGVAMIKLLASHIEGSEQATEVVIGIAGILDERKESLAISKHLPGYHGHHLKAEFEKALGIETYLENDTMLGALGEATFGAGDGAPIVAYVAVGTGIGGARVVDGTLDRNVRGFEIGHQYLGSGNGAKELEELVSGSSILATTGKRASDIHDEAFWDERSKEFAYGLYNTLLHWSPSVVVLGGSLFKGIGMKKESIATHLTSINRIIPTLPPLVYASLSEPGLYGGSVYTSPTP